MFAKYLHYQQAKNFVLVYLLIMSLLLTSCAKKNLAVPTVTQPPKLPPMVKLNVANVASSGGSITSIRAGESIAIVVDIQPYEVLPWTWEVSGTSGGNVNPNQGENTVYTAGQAGIDTVTARTNLADGTPIKQSIVITVEPPATEAPPPTETPLPPKVTLDNFQDNQKVPCSNLASGTYPDGLDKAIWPVVFVGGVYHPQDEGGKAAQKANGQWFQTVRFGDCNNPNKDIGTAFQLIIVTANESANVAFEAYLANAKKTGKWSGMSELPPGTNEQVRVIVIRE